jgi:hypothetical protein
MGHAAFASAQELQKAKVTIMLCFFVLHLFFYCSNVLTDLIE